MGQLEEMTVFIRIVKAGEISRAAEQLGLTKSTVNHRLVDLEKRLGVRLLNRNLQSSSLTENGQNYYDRAIKIVDDVAELNLIAINGKASLEGSINLTAPLLFGLRHLSPAIDEFLNQHPELTINIDFSDRPVDLVKEELDLAFRITDLQDSNLITRKISPIKHILCASPKYFEENGIPEKPGDLKNHPLLYYNISKTKTWNLEDKKGKKYAMSVKAKIITSNGDFLNDIALAGHGIVLTPTFIASKAISTGQLIPVLTDYKLPHLSAYVAYPKTHLLSQQTKVLIDFLVERFGNSPYWDKEINF